MAPYSSSSWTEEATQELFTSLFGNYEKGLLRKGQADANGVDEDLAEEESDMKIL